MDLARDLVALASSAGKTKYNYDKPEAALLERFPNPCALPTNPVKGKCGLLITCPEVTSLCPLTGQPDFATIIIRYEAANWCVESKSLKLYLMSFRNHGEFHEAMVTRIGNDLVKLIEPNWMEVEGQFTPRGGIPFWPTFVYERPKT